MAKDKDKPFGRPRKDFTEKEWIQIQQMCSYMCTGEEIAGTFEIGYSTLQRRIREHYDMTFDQFYHVFSSPGKTSLRRMQWKLAAKGNFQAQKWLGIQHLGQKDRHDHTTNDKDINLVLIDKDDAAL